MQLPIFLDIKFESSIVQNFVVSKAIKTNSKGVLKEELSDMSKHDILSTCKVKVLYQWDVTTTFSMSDATSGTIVIDSHHQTSIH
jgi:hypothetical protein